MTATVRDSDGSDVLRGLRDGGAPLTILAADLADPATIGGCVAEAMQAMGGIDVVLNNAGVNAMSYPDGRGTLAVDTLSAGPMHGIFAVNTIAPLLVVQAALPELRRSAFPRIVNISSWIGSIHGAGSGNYAYATSKAALNMATRLLAHELAGDDIVVMAVNPGWMQTAMGGSRAELRPEESARGVVDLIERSGPHHSGRFLQWDGTEHPW